MSQLETTKKLENLDAAEHQLCDFLQRHHKNCNTPDPADSYNTQLLYDIRDRRQEIYLESYVDTEQENLVE